MNQFDRQRVHHKSYHQTEILIMPTRNEGTITANVHVEAPHLVSFLKERKLRFFPYVLFACLVTVKKHPVMRRFVMGHRIYEHKRLWISTVIKKDKSDETSNHFVKFEIKEAMKAADIQSKLDEQIIQTKSDRVHSSDRLITGLSLIPGFLFSIGIKIAAWMDRMDLLPNAIIQSDPLHTNLIIANLGSIQGQNVAHHLFNWGTCSLVITIGEFDSQGKVDFTFSIDERIGEGLAFFRAIDTFKKVLEDPYGFDE
jgi:chloramphenicol O-acetyltransferase